MLIERSINGRIMVLGSCPTCNKEIGFRRRYDLSKPCRSCANSIAKKGTSSPKKGIKTGKPAWNKGLKFSSIPEEHKILRRRIKTALNIRLKAHGFSKCYQHSFDLLGYSAEDLKKHLESKFLPGMSWDNHGEWHIDHVVPDSYFTYSSTNDSGFKKSWALENLQPLWAVDNIKKSNKLPEGM